MKKNKMMRMASALLVATLLSTSIIAGTFAKYTTNVEGSDSAVVAKWSVKATVGQQEFGKASTTLNLFDESKVYDTASANYTKEGIADTDVKKGSNKAIIAPGTWGEFEYTLTNDSEVNATYAVTYTVDEKNVPLEWSVDGQNWTNDLANINATTINMNATATQKVYWRWAYGDSTVETSKSDTNDTTLGTAVTLAEPSVKIAVTFTQVD